MEQNKPSDNIWIVKANRGRFIVSKKEKEAINILSPRGIRILARKTDLCAVIHVRIEDGRRLFWKEHIRKLELHCEELDLLVPNEDELEDMFWKLWHAQECKEATLRIVVTADDILIHYAEQTGAGKQADEGIACTIIEWDKEDYWSVKRQDELFRLKNQGIYLDHELLLMDEDGIIYKGTRSNIYFIKDGQIKTATNEPGFHGVTRKYVFEAVRNAGQKIQEEDIKRSLIYQKEIDSAFLVSSIMGIVPVKSIDGILLNIEHPILKKVKEEYNKLLEEIKNQD